MKNQLPQDDLQKISMRAVWIMLALPPLLLAFLIFSYIGIGQFDPSSPQTEEALRQALPYILAINHLILFALLAFLLSRKGIRLSAIGLKLPSSSLIKEAIIGLLGALALYLFKELVADSIRALIAGNTPTFFSLFRFELGQIYLPMALAAAGLVFVEESIYRGLAISRLTQRFGVIRSILISSAFFSLLHWGNGLDAIFNGAVFGVFFSGFYLWRHNLVAGIIAHAGYNILVLAT